MGKDTHGLRCVVGEYILHRLWSHNRNSRMDENTHSRMCDRRTIKPKTEVSPKNPQVGSQMMSCVTCGEGDTKTTNLKGH